MSAETVGILGIVVLVILLFARMWLGLAMALVGICGLISIKGFGPAFGVITTVPYENVAYYPFSTIPLFLLMGVLIANSGIGEELYNTAHKLVGQLRGGLAMATVLAGAFFAAITGISTAALATLGKVALPEMRRHQYDESLATGSIACAGTLAFLIPPSIAFIIYGILTEQSIGKLFMAGILPGVLLTVLFILTIGAITTLRPQAGPAGPKTSFREKIVSLKDTWHVIFLFLLVLGGIYGGIFTPTEAGAVGAFGTIVIAAALRKLTLKSLYNSLMETAQVTAMIFLLIIGAYIFIKFLALSKVPFMLCDLITQLSLPPMAIFAGIVVLYIVLGMFLDIFSTVILTVPVIYPATVALGFDPIWFGVMVVLVIQMGLVTPPVGLDVFILSGMTGVPAFTIFRGVTPFLVAVVICVVILAIFPRIALFIPGMM